MADKYVFHGHSDDNFCEVNHIKEESCNHGKGTPIRFKIQNLVGEYLEGLIVSGTYSPNGSGCWFIGVEPVDEMRFPHGWNIYFDNAKEWGAPSYSMVLVVEAPDTCIMIAMDEDESDYE